MNYNFIVSKTLKEYLEKNNIALTDHQKAIIIMNTYLKGYDCDHYLNILHDETEDIVLRTEIEEYYSYNKCKFDALKRLDDREVFLLEYKDKRDDDCIILSDNFDHLLSVGNATDKEFIITRYKYDCDIDVGRYMYDPESANVVDIEYSQFEYNFTYDDPYDYFYETYFRMPYPFREGDYVRDINTGSIGIFHGQLPGHDDDFLKWCNEPLSEQEKICSTFDMTSTCEFFFEDNADFGHVHVHVWGLEKITEEDIPKELRDYFRVASAYVKDGMFLENLFYYQCEYKRNKEKKLEDK